MHAYVYKSLKKADTFVYLAARDDFTRLPEPLRSQLGQLQFVLDVALVPERKLAREDVAVDRLLLADQLPGAGFGHVRAEQLADAFCAAPPAWRCRGGA